MPPLREGSDPRRTGNTMELKLRDVAQLFNPLDPSPISEKDLDRNVEEFIVSWAHELPPRRELRLVVRLGTPLPAGYTADAIQTTVRHYFRYRAAIHRLDLRQLLRRGRMSLLIGLSFLSACLLLARILVPYWSKSALADIARESLTIGGWVAMWRPMEIYLYDWWPIRQRVKLLDRLSRMEVELHVLSG
jgi:hypothetical protein